MGAYNRNRKSALQQAIVVQIKISIALTDLLIKLQNITINRFNLRREGVCGEGGGGRLQSDVLRRNPPGNWVIIF